MTTRTPLEDPAYQPAHPPLPGGSIPAVVERWGPRSQLRWFTRYNGQVAPRRVQDWERWHCESVDHRGLCCPSCVEDDGTEWGWTGGGCCCRSMKDGAL